MHSTTSWCHVKVKVHVKQIHTVGGVKSQSKQNAEKKEMKGSRLDLSVHYPLAGHMCR